MPDERLILAIGRLERALSRVEAAADRVSAPPMDEPDPALRHRVGEAIARLDALLGDA